MSNLENHSIIVLDAFAKFENFGYQLIESKIELKNEGFKHDQITITFQSIDRILTVHYLSNLNYLSELAIKNIVEYVGISMTNRNLNVQIIKDDNLDIVHYFRLKLPEIYLTELKLYNNSAKSGISLAKFEKKITRYATMILEELNDVVVGKKWISTSLTRLDGWRIETDDGIKYYDY